MAPVCLNCADTVGMDIVETRQTLSVASPAISQETILAQVSAGVLEETHNHGGNGVVEELAYAFVDDVVFSTPSPQDAEMDAAFFNDCTDIVYWFRCCARHLDGAQGDAQRVCSYCSQAAHFCTLNAQIVLR